MELSQLTNGVTIVGCVVYAVLIAFCVRKLSFRRSMAPVYFTFALVSNLMSGFYWLAYNLLRGSARMPFAANEFGEIAAFLLMASTLNAVFRGRFAAARLESGCTALFAAASCGLWIAWSGEWLEDILTGLSFGYYLCVCVRSLKQTAALSRVEWVLLGVAAATLLVLQGLTFVLPAPWKSIADGAAYAVMFLTLAYGIWRSGRALLQRNNAPAPLALAAFCMAWTLSTLYMSESLFYRAAQAINIVCPAMTMIALHREEAAV